MLQRERQGDCSGSGLSRVQRGRSIYSARQYGEHPAGNHPRWSQRILNPSYSTGFRIGSIVRVPLKALTLGISLVVDLDCFTLESNSEFATPTAKREHPFIVSYASILYYKRLGLDIFEVFKRMELCNPDCNMETDRRQVAFGSCGQCLVIRGAVRHSHMQRKTPAVA